MEERTYLSGTSLAGMSPTRSRVENDYYATPFEATEAILSREELHGSILEPAAGEGHFIAAPLDLLCCKLNPTNARFAGIAMFPYEPSEAHGT